MENLMKSFLIFVSIFLFSALYCNQQLKAQNLLKIEVQNVSKFSGKVCLALYNSEETYMEEDKVYSYDCVDANSNSVTLEIKDLPDGNYAFSVLHDANNNDKIDLGFLGIPKEDYCFSNNAKGFMGPPDFKKAKFTVDKNSLKKLVVRL